MSGTCIAKILHGSHLYGTAGELSDVDLKSVWIPCPRDIVLGRTGMTESNNDGSRTNGPEDVDHEASDLMRFVELLVAGHPTALECLHAPSSCHMVVPSETWWNLIANAPCFIAPSPGSFIGYAEEQAPAFGIAAGLRKGAEAALAAMREMDGKSLLSEVADDIVRAAASSDVAVVRKSADLVLRVGGRSFPLATRLAAARKTTASFLEAYGERLRKAQDEDVRDWRAVSHAIRIAEEGTELLTSGRITFPRPNAGELVEIKHGRLPRTEVAALLESDGGSPAGR